MALSSERIKTKNGKLNKNLPKKIKITAIRIGKNIINDLIVLASFFVSARTKALSDQITITTNIANNINLNKEKIMTTSQNHFLGF